MIRIIASTIIILISNAIALVVGALVLEDMSLNSLSFVIAVALFTGITILIEPLLRQMAIKNAPVLLGSSSLIATLLSLVITVAISNGLSISGVSTWVLATVLVWAVALASRLLLPLVIFKKVLANRQSAA